MDSHQRTPALLSVQQAADASCVSAHTVRRWISDGALPVHRSPEGAVQVSVDDVQKLLRSKVWVTPFAAKIWAPA